MKKKINDTFKAIKKTFLFRRRPCALQINSSGVGYVA